MLGGLTQGAREWKRTMYVCKETKGDQQRRSCALFKYIHKQSKAIQITKSLKLGCWPNLGRGKCPG